MRVPGGTEGWGSQRLLLCSRFASPRQLLGNSIPAAAGKHQNVSPHPRPHLHRGLAGWHSLAQPSSAPWHLHPPTRPQRSDPQHPTRDPKMLPPIRAALSPPPGVAIKGVRPWVQAVPAARAAAARSGASDSRGWRRQEGKLRHGEAMLTGGSRAAAGPRGRKGPGASCRAKGRAHPWETRPRSGSTGSAQLLSPRLGTDGGTAGAERAISLINLLLFLLTSWDLEQGASLPKPAPPFAAALHSPAPAAERGVRSLQALLKTDLV